MGRIPEHVIDQVRERADIVQIASRYLTLKKSGSRHWGLCPFHTEKTPSFQVHEDKQVFHCFLKRFSPASSSRTTRPSKSR